MSLIQLVCGRCRGRRVIETACSMCHDSTWDHECDDTSTPCPDCGGAPPTTARVLADVFAERARQDAKWGELNHPLVRIPQGEPGVIFSAHTASVLECQRLGLRPADRAREFCDNEHKIGGGTFASIAVEELAEAVEAAVTHGETSDAARNELVQAAAVLVAMIESLDRRRGVR